MELFDKVYYFTEAGFIKKGEVVLTDKDKVFIQDIGWISKDKCYATTESVNIEYLKRSAK